MDKNSQIRCVSRQNARIRGGTQVNFVNFANPAMAATNLGYIPRHELGVYESDIDLMGDAENARHEIAKHENAAPDCKGGKCET